MERSGDVKDAIHAAVLATSAYELLGHMTPALSIEPLELRRCCVNVQWHAFQPLPL